MSELHEKTEVKLTLRTIIVSVVAIVVTVSSGVFFLTRAVISDHVDALEERLDSARASGQLPLPINSTQSTQVDPELEKLTVKLTDLEKEREVLVQQLVSKSTNSLDPESELAGLISQVNSDLARSRVEGAEGLFLLNDSRAIPTLVGFLNAHRDEATNVRFMWQWYDMFWSLEPQSGIVVGLNELLSDSPDDAEDAYEELYVHIWKNAPSTASQSRLESIALTSEDSLTRTRAKLLLQRVEDRRAYDESAEADRLKFEQELEERRQSLDGETKERSVREILLGIESKLGITPEEP